VSLLSGDQVTIDWSSQTDSYGNNYASELAIYPAGTSDFSMNNTSYLNCFQIGNNHDQESTFSANSDGTYPLIFLGGAQTGGAYSFTVYVSHAVVLGVPRIIQVSPTRSQITVQAHSPDGKPISDQKLTMTLSGNWLSQWHVLSTSSPSNGDAVLHLTLPSSLIGKTIRLRVSASGGGYRLVRSSVQTVRVIR
jgi:hypothetical protein